MSLRWLLARYALVIVVREAMHSVRWKPDDKMAAFAIGSLFAWPFYLARPLWALTGAGPSPRAFVNPFPPRWAADLTAAAERIGAEAEAPGSTDFYELPHDRLDDLCKLAHPGLRSMRSRQTRLHEMLASLRRPTPRHEESEPFLSTLLAYLDENGTLETAAKYADLLLDLGEGHGGDWLLIKPRAGLVDSLDQSSFDEDELRQYYEEDREDCPQAGAAMLRQLPVIQTALRAIRDDSLLLVHDD